MTRVSVGPPGSGGGPVPMMGDAGSDGNAFNAGNAGVDCIAGNAGRDAGSSEPQLGRDRPWENARRRRWFDGLVVLSAITGRRLRPA